MLTNFHVFTRSIENDFGHIPLNVDFVCFDWVALRYALIMIQLVWAREQPMWVVRHSSSVLNGSDSIRAVPKLLIYYYHLWYCSVFSIFSAFTIYNDESLHHVSDCQTLSGNHAQILFLSVRAVSNYCWCSEHGEVLYKAHLLMISDPLK